MDHVGARATRLLSEVHAQVAASDDQLQRLAVRLAGGRHRLRARERDEVARCRATLRRSFLADYRTEAW